MPGLVPDRALARRVSDEAYFSDFARTLLAASERSLPMDFLAARALPAGWTLSVGAVRWQNILDARISPPYDRLPQVQQSLMPFYGARGMRWMTYGKLVYGWLVENQAPHTNWQAAENRPRPVAPRIELS